MQGKRKRRHFRVLVCENKSRKMDNEFISERVIEFLDDTSALQCTLVCRTMKMFDITSFWQRRFQKKLDRITLKRSIHLRHLMRSNDLSTLIEEICTRNQWRIMKYVLYRYNLLNDCHKAFYSRPLNIQNWLRFAIRKEIKDNNAKRY